MVAKRGDVAQLPVRTQARHAEAAATSPPGRRPRSARCRNALNGLDPSPSGRFCVVKDRRGPRALIGWKVRGAQWKLPQKGCCGRAGSCLWAHLKHERTEHFAVTEQGEIARLYGAALFIHQSQKVPTIGYSVDRRTLRRLANHLRETSCVPPGCGAAGPLPGWFNLI